MSEFLLLLSLARNVLTAMRKEEAKYREAVREWYEEGDGRKPEWTTAGTQEWFDPEWDDPSRPINIGGLGYAFPYCPHGTSLWTDYDNICGGCEDSTRTTQRAVWEAESLLSQFNERLAWASKAPTTMPTELRDAMWAYVAEPTTRYPKV